MRRIMNKKRKRVDFQDCHSFYPDVFDGKDVDWYDRIVHTVTFQHATIKVFGKEYKEPRYTALFGDKEGVYKYSGKADTMKPMPQVVREIRDAVKDFTGVYYDFVLINYYKDGKHKVGWHADNEKGMNPDSVASVSLGPGERRFLVRTKDDLPEIVFDQRLPSGSLFIMGANMQDGFKHCVPVEAKVDKARINLTFRQSK